MAVQSSFKQRCPSCEAMVSVKENMIGKKIECTKCKDKFIAKPPEDEIEIVEDEPKQIKKKNTASTEKTPSGKAGKNTAVAGKRPKMDIVEEVDDDIVEDFEEVDQKPKKASGKADKNAGVTSKRPKLDIVEEIDDDIEEIDDDEPKKGKAKNKARKDDEDNAEPESAPTKKKDNTNSNKLVIGLGLAVVGVIILVVAGLVLMSNRRPPAGGGAPIVIKPGGGGGGVPDDEEDEKKKKKKIDQEDDKKDKKPVLAAKALTDAERAKLTNFLPPETEHVFHVNFDAAFPADNALRSLVFQKVGTLEDAEIKKRIGFSLLDIDDILCAERYSSTWRFTIVHFRELIKEEELKTALRLKPGGQIKGQTYYEFPDSNPNPWFERFARFTFGVPNQVRQFDPHGGARTTLLRFHDAQTMILGDETPMKAFLDVKGEFKKQGAEAAWLEPRRGRQTFVSTNAEPVNAWQPEGEREHYRTIKKSLKDILDKMESRGADGKDNVIFSSATDMEAGVVATNLPEFNKKVVRRPRQFWDATLLLNESTARIRHLGTSLTVRDAMRYQLRNEILCDSEDNARKYQADLESGANSMARTLRRLTGLTLNTPAAVEKKPDPEAKPDEKKEGGSEIRVSLNFSTVEFVVDLTADVPTQKQLHPVLELLASSMRVDLDAAGSPSLRHALAKAGRQLPEGDKLKDLVAELHFPPGAFKRDNTQFRIDREPKNRISWMAGLLPYLGHDRLFHRIHFNQSWRDSSNWLAGNTLVPQFLDPAYPHHTRYTAVEGASLDYATTHFVGIAGVGLDAASYKRGDKATEHLRGVFSYDESCSVGEIRLGRGTANTIMMIQIPHDGIAGVRPWMAGGGATLRGVPEKNSIRPFVLSKDRNGNVIRHNNKNGTYALMSDGSVRFIDENVSDDVFKAMCTIKGPNPAGFNLKTDANTPEVLEPVP